MKLKKLLLVAGVATVGVMGFKWAGNSIERVTRTARQEAREVATWVEGQVPMEKRFEQLRRDAQAIDGEMEKVKNDLAREIVEVRDLTNRTAELRASVEKTATALTARGQAIDDATEKVKYGTRTFSKTEALAELQKDVNRYTRDKSRLASMEATLVNRETIKETLSKTLDSMKTKKAEVLAAIDEVEADYKQLQLAAVESKYQADEQQAFARPGEALEDQPVQRRDEEHAGQDLDRRQRVGDVGRGGHVAIADGGQRLDREEEPLLDRPRRHMVDRPRRQGGEGRAE